MDLSPPWHLPVADPVGHLPLDPQRSSCPGRSCFVDHPLLRRELLSQPAPLAPPMQFHPVCSKQQQPLRLEHISIQECCYPIELIHLPLLLAAPNSQGLH